MSNKQINVMCDLETLGTRPGCKLLSLAAVPFCIDEHIIPFYAKILSTSFPAGFHEDPKTLAWWKDQSAEARDEALSGIRHINNVLDDFSYWVGYLPGEMILWGNGADFDNAILAETYHKLSLIPRWKHWNNRCYRTLKNLYPQFPFVKPKVAHNALSDATAQAVHAEQILEGIARSFKL